MLVDANGYMVRDDVRVRRDWIDVRHEYLVADGRWIAGACAKAGFCRECNNDREGEPHPGIHIAFKSSDHPTRSARHVIAAHLWIAVDVAHDDYVLFTTPFRRLSIAKDLQMVGGIGMDDDAVLAADTVGDLIRLAIVPEERADMEKVD